MLELAATWQNTAMTKKIEVEVVTAKASKSPQLAEINRT